MHTTSGFTGFIQPSPLPTFLDAQHSYGLPLRPGTPIKAVVGNLYGEVAAYQKSKYA
jgi:CRISPR/Cas system CMR subunit Cmr6 (Cas7 group RAMP superfamily)